MIMSIFDSSLSYSISIFKADGGIFVAYIVKDLVAYHDLTLTRPHRLLLPHLFLSPPGPERETSLYLLLIQRGIPLSFGIWAGMCSVMF